MEEAGESDFAGDAFVPGVCAFFLGVTTAGASQISISSKLSSSSIRKASGSGLLRWTEAVGVASVAAAAVLSEVRQEGFASPRSNCVAFCSPPPPPPPPTPSGLATLVDCAGASAEDPGTDVLGISVFFTSSGRAAETGLFGSGCSTRGALAFLFPRSLLVNVGFFCDGSSVLSLFSLAVPLRRRRRRRVLQTDRLLY